MYCKELPDRELERELRDLEEQMHKENLPSTVDDATGDPGLEIRKCSTRGRETTKDKILRGFQALDRDGSGFLSRKVLKTSVGESVWLCL